MHKYVCNNKRISGKIRDNTQARKTLTAPAFNS